MINGLELRFPLIGDNLSGVLFHDAGNVYSKLKSVRFLWCVRKLISFNLEYTLPAS